MTTPIFTIQRDSREKKGLTLPSLHRWTDPTTGRERMFKIHVEDVRLETYDYATFAAGSGVAIETKRSLAELAANTAPGRGLDKFRDCLRRARDSYYYSLLIIEGGLNTLYARPDPTYAGTIERLQHVLLEYNTPYVLVPEHTQTQRRYTAQFVTSWLITAASTTTQNLCRPPAL